MHELDGSIKHKDPIAFIFYQLRQTHFGLVLMCGLMIGFGVMMQYSAAQGEWYPWAGAQLSKLVFILPVVLALHLIHTRWLIPIAWGTYALGIILLLAVLAMGTVGLGAKRWLMIGGITVQPSEFMKVALLMALAAYYERIHPDDVRRFYTLIPPLVLIAVPAFLILKQPNLGTAIITVSIGAGVMFYAGVNWKLFALAAAGVAGSIPVAWQMMHAYQKQRVLTFLDPEKDPLGAGYNIIQSKIAIGSGGLSGKGFVQGSQSQLEFLPEKQTDFIFTMIAEEWGFLGGLVTLGMMFAIIMTCMMIAHRVRHTFGKIIALGFGFMLFIHMLINAGMVMGLLPVVGVPMPFLSYGGSHLMSMVIGMALVLNVYVHRDYRLSL